VPEPSYSGYARGYVATIAEGTAQRHENVLMDIADPWHLADLLANAVTRSTTDRTISLFDDGITLRIDRLDDETWRITCRPVPLPPRDSNWKSFPEFSFVVGRTELERARREAGALAARLRDE